MNNKLFHSKDIPSELLVHIEELFAKFEELRGFL